MRSHLILSTVGSRGPSPDIGQLEKNLQALPRVAIECLVADAGHDSEKNHELIRSRGMCSLIPPWHGRRPKGIAKGRWRRTMFFRFKTKPPKYRQRWQIETTFSMLKRNLSPNVTARFHYSHRQELFLKVLTHNAMILWCLSLELFYLSIPGTFLPGQILYEKCYANILPYFQFLVWRVKI